MEAPASCPLFPLGVQQALNRQEYLEWDGTLKTVGAHIWVQRANGCPSHSAGASDWLGVALDSKRGPIPMTLFCDLYSFLEHWKGREKNLLETDAQWLVVGEEEDSKLVTIRCTWRMVEGH